MSAAYADAIVVAGETEVRTMGAHLLSDDREQPAVGLAVGAGSGELALSPGHVRMIVGAEPRIYLIAGEHWLRGLADLLGRRLALPAGAARVWWPGLTLRSDPFEHPLLFPLDDERELDLLAEFARRFELSRPLVRREIRLIEDARALLEHELAKEREQGRNLKVARHEALTRAEAAEVSLRKVRGQLARMGRQEEPRRDGR